MLRPVSKVVVKFLRLMQKHGYIGDLEIIDDHRSGKIVIDLVGRINKTGESIALLTIYYNIRI